MFLTPMKKPLLLQLTRAGLLAVALFSGGCVGAAPFVTPAASVSPPTATAQWTPAPTAAPVPTLAPLSQARLGGSANVPAALRAALLEESQIVLAEPGQPADLYIEAAKIAHPSPQAVWVYALVAPFPTLVDEISAAELRLAWRGLPSSAFAGQPLLVSPETQRVFEALWGKSRGVEIVPAHELLDRAWSVPRSWAIVPFEALEPRWKVLRIEGLSPLDRGLVLADYPLAIHYRLNGDPAALAVLDGSGFPFTNRDERLMTSLVMTGVTALTRGIAEKMDENGAAYPAEEIGRWLRTADLTHISNEVSFYPDCPPPARRDPRFCSHPGYLALLEEVGTDVVELTGNHLLDWGALPFLDTLTLYQEKEWLVYGGGSDHDSARQAVTLTDHGNRIAFIGCNAAGPESVWAAGDQPGVARCDFDWLSAEVTRLREEGWLVVVTFQHVEVCQLEPHLAQRADFNKPAAAGAVIVSGSQAHCPQAAAFTGHTFIHYGLGNLFFDQMDSLARRQVIDRHVFYNGKHISTELMTAILEDYARPRPAVTAERQKLLEDIFRASGWIK